jgi:phosphatidylglycerophosphatase A
MGLSWLHSNRNVHWEKLTGFRSRIAFCLATVFGTGLLPWAPGTFGTLAALPVVGLTFNLNDLTRFLFWTGLFLVGSWSAQVVDETMGTSDNQNIVIDEVLGYGISSWSAGINWECCLAAFFLFRFFDVMKFFPVRELDHWSKLHSKSSFLKGMGVMADDAVAGVQALCVVWILQHYFHFLPVLR